MKSELANVRIIFKNPDIMSFNDVAYRLMNQAQDYSIDLEVFYKHIIGMINGENSKQSNFISLYNNLYPNNSIITIGVNHCSERLLDNAIIYMCDKICLDLRKNKVLTDFLLNFSFKKECNAESWISNFITYLVSMEKTELLDKYSIIPNQNGVLCRKIDLYREADSIPDFMKDVCRVAGTDFRDELSSTAIEASKIIQHRKGYKEISEVITSYMHRHMNNINVNHDDKEAFNQTYRWLRDKKRENLPNTHREAISIFKN